MQELCSSAASGETGSWSASFVAAIRAIQCGVTYTEGFTLCLVALKITTKKMLP